MSRALARAAVLLVLVLVLGAGRPMAETRTTLLDFADLDGWAEDDHGAALDAFRVTCGDLTDRTWANLCDLAATGPDARTFFELFFRPVLIEDGTDTLFTGYFEPEIRGALEPDERYRHPIYLRPQQMPDSGPWLSRAEIEAGALEGQGLEIAWIDDPVDAYFLHVQGSGRIRLPDGSTIRVGYADANRRPYTSVGQELVARGVYEPHEVSAEVIRSWVRRNGEAGLDLLRTNESFVFFRIVNEVPPDKGPLGAMNRSITMLRTVAIDPAFVPLGAPVWIEKDGEDPLRRLMVAQDTGSAIKGAQRADIFYGTGRAAGLIAGRVRDGGRMVVLLPIQKALARLPSPEIAAR